MFLLGGFDFSLQDFVRFHQFRLDLGLSLAAFPQCIRFFRRQFRIDFLQFLRRVEKTQADEIHKLLRRNGFLSLQPRQFLSVFIHEDHRRIPFDLHLLLQLLIARLVLFGHELGVLREVDVSQIEIRLRVQLPFRLREDLIVHDFAPLTPVGTCEQHEQWRFRLLRGLDGRIVIHCPNAFYRAILLNLRCRRQQCRQHDDDQT